METRGPAGAPRNAFDKATVTSEFQSELPPKRSETVIALALTLALLPTKPAHATADVPPVPSTQPAEATARSDSKKESTISVHRGSLANAVDAQGYFEPAEPYDLRIRPKVYAGELTIKSIAANGAAVKKGDIILEIDPATIDKQLAAVDNEVAAAHANLAKSQADAKIGQAQDELALKMQTEATQRAEDEVKWFHDVDGPNLLLQNEQGVKNVKANVDDQQDELNELKKMYKSDDLTTDTADIVVKRAVRNLENTKIALKIATENAQKVKDYIYPARKENVLEAAKQSEQQLEALKAAQAQSKVLRETGLATTTAGAKAADERLADLRADKEKLTVRAPADGVVLYGQFAGGAFQNTDERSLRPGERIAAQQAVVTFYTPGKLRLHVDLPEAKFFEIHPGSRATIKPVAFADEKVEGTCDHAPGIPVNTQQGPVYPLTISCSEVDPKLVPGMRGNVHVESHAAELAILVPNSAVADGHVWVKTEDGIERHDVVVGKSDGKHTEIKRGLNDGDEILVEAQK
jgi:HlyD family secretion protein